MSKPKKNNLNWDALCVKVHIPERLTFRDTLQINQLI